MDLNLKSNFKRVILLLLAWSNLASVSLKDWDPQRTLNLDSEWLFFYGEHLAPEEALRRLQNPNFKTTSTRIGNSFRDSVGPTAKQEYGVATYLLRLQDGPGSFQEPLGLFPNNIYTASRFYFFTADGQGMQRPIMQLGEPGFTKETSRPQFGNSKAVRLSWYGAQDHFLLVQVSNFHYHRSGIRTPPELGSYRLLHDKLRTMDDIVFLAFGIIMLATIYNLFLYLNRREDKGPLFLGLFGVFMLVRFFALATYADNIFGEYDLSHEIFWKIVFSTMTVPGVLFLYYLRTYFPRQTPNRVLFVYALATAIFTFMVLILPIRVYGSISSGGKLMSAVFAFTALFIAIRATRARELGAAVSLMGCLALLLSGGLDLLSLLGVRQMPTDSASYGWAIFCVMQGQIIAMRFASAFESVEKMTAQLKIEVDHKLREVNAILQNIKQGILMLVSPKGETGAQFSKEATVILGQSSISGSHVSSLILDHSTLNSEQKSQILSTLEASIGEDRLGFELNQECLPSEVQWSDPQTGLIKIIELDWTPICNKNQIVEKIMLCLRDVTALRELQREALQHEEDLQIFQELLELPEDRFQRFVSQSHEYLRENRELIMQFSDQTKKSEILRQLFINMHTLKGTARSFLLKSISAATHDVEQYYASIQKSDGNWDSHRLLDDLNRVSRIVSQYEQIGKAKLGWNSEEKMVRINRSMLLEKLQTLQTIRPQLKTEKGREESQRLQSHLVELCYDRLSDVLEDCTRGFDGIARSLQKIPPQFVITNSPILLHDTGSDLIHSIMTHLLRNSLDHGLETPERRQALGKPPQGTIRVDISEPLANVVLQVSDDGSGLNLHRIENLARQQGLVKNDQTLSDTEIAEIIFLAGFSTKDLVTEISGRGVGLDAVKTYLENAGATIHIRLKEGVHDRECAPFHFEIRLPASLWVASFAAA